MAEKSGELTNLDKPDLVSAVPGNENRQSLERTGDNFEDVRELSRTTDETPEETEQLKARIEETRNQMGETIDAIQERLSFANISEQVSETVNNAIETAKDTAYQATIGKAVNLMKNVGDGISHSGAFRTVKKNPFPLALIGLGAGLLVYQAMGKRSDYRTGNGRGRERRNHDEGFDVAATGRSTYNTTKRSLTDATSRAYDGIAERANSALEGVSSAAGSAYDAVSGKATDIYSGANDLAHRAYDRAGEFGTMAHDKYDEYLEENPLALGAIAVAIGAAVGFAIPSTPYEGRLMGDARDNVLQRAQDAAGSLVDRAKQVATEAGQTIKQETQQALGQ